MRLHTARLDPAISAVIDAPRALRYTDDAVALDRGPHVRAASGVAWYAQQLIVLQDDASFLGTIDLERGVISAVALPAGPDGARRFDSERGNKQHKLDLEACTVVDDGNTRSLLAIGSGSTAARERLVLLTHRDEGFTARVIDGSRFYAALRADPSFTTSELNLEGMVLQGEWLRLFQRSNGTAHATVKRCATVDLRWSEVEAFLAAPNRAPVPALHAIRHYDLGTIDGVPLTFTDASAWDAERVLFVASAEGSPNAVDDGHVTGTAIGILEADGSARLCHLRDRHGKLVTAKAEGIARRPDAADRAWLVFDPDDHHLAATLTEVTLAGL